MASALYQSIEILSRDKGIDPAIVVGAVEDAIALATRKYYKTQENMRGELNKDTGEITAYIFKTVVAGDDEMGRCSWFRGQLRARGECYLLAVPSNTSVRDLTAPDPPYAGHGRRPRVPFVRVDRWCAALPEAAWQTVEVRDGEKAVEAALRAYELTGGKNPYVLGTLAAASAEDRDFQAAARLRAGTSPSVMVSSARRASPSDICA